MSSQLQDRYRILALDKPSKALSLAEMNTAMLKLLGAESIQRVTILVIPQAADWHKLLSKHAQNAWSI